MKRRILAGFLTVCLLFTQSFTATVRAEEEQEQPDPLEAEKAASLAVPPETNSVEGWPQGPGVYADSAIVMDIDSKAVLYGKRIDVQHYPASITKILTTLIALENAELTDEVSFSQASVDFLEYGDAHIGMHPGEVISLQDALYAVLLASANEVSYAVAESVGNRLGGGYDAFIQKMNERSAELGCKNSHWTNANGLHDEQHYTTAYDMALIGAAVYPKEAFRTITQTLQYTIPPTNLIEESRTFQQNHKMLYEQNQYCYPYCTGGKTGFTDQARTTLVTFAEKDGMRLVCVNLRSFGGVAYTDTTAMFDYAFSGFRHVSMKDYLKEDQVEKCLTEEPVLTLPKGADPKDLQIEYQLAEGGKKRQAVLTYTYHGQTAGTADVILKPSYYKEVKKISDPTVVKVKEKAEKTESINMQKIILIILGVLSVSILVVTLVLREKRKRIRSRRRKLRGEKRKSKDEKRSV